MDFENLLEFVFVVVFDVVFAFVFVFVSICQCQPINWFWPSIDAPAVSRATL